MGKALGTFRAVYLVALCCIGSFLFAYDTGVVGGVLTLAPFQKDFGYGSAQKTSVSSNATSLLQAGGMSSKSSGEFSPLDMTKSSCLESCTEELGYSLEYISNIRE
jgi:hypothetical protein